MARIFAKFLLGYKDFPASLPTASYKQLAEKRSWVSKDALKRQTPIKYNMTMNDSILVYCYSGYNIPLIITSKSHDDL